MSTPEAEAGREIAPARPTGLAVGSGASLLGERQVRMPVSGKIRSGLKVLTAKYASHQDAVRIYQAGVAAGASWDAIEARIRRTLGLGDDAKASPMRPTNAPYFTVKRADFTMPEIADRIFDEYAEERDGERHVYRLPVVFLFDTWLGNLPHGFETYRGGRRIFWSEYGPDGTRYCKTYGEQARDERAQRYVRDFGGRPVQLRAENDGLCVPSSCAEYQRGECKLRGQLIAAIPKIPGGPVSMKTTSFYGLEAMRAQMEMMQLARGRLAGLYNGQPMFWLTKREQTVARLENGESKLVKQYLPVLETTADLTALLGHYTDDDDHDEHIAAATSVLEGAPAPAVDTVGATIDGATGEVVPERVSTSAADILHSLRTGTPMPEREGQEQVLDPRIPQLRELMGANLRRLRIRYADFAPYAEKCHDAYWLDNADVLDRVVRELDGINDDKRADYVSRVNQRTPF